MKIYLALIIVSSIVFSSFSLSQNKDTLNIKSSKLTELQPKIGFQIGSHSSNLTKTSSDKFNRDIAFELFLKFNLSSEVHPIIAFTYWKAKSNERNTFFGQIPSETMISKGLKLEVDFSLFKIYSVTLSVGPSVAIENITGATNTVFSLGTNAKLALPLWNNKVNVLSIAGYQTGASAFALAGGGVNYSFFSYLVGIEINLGN
ncbi:MAG: hypothetical protein WCS69_02915 [Ignavibacteriaceae bacterium]|jgi:hypothetical protein